MFADAFNLFLIYSKIEPERAVDFCGEAARRACVSVATSKRANQAKEKTEKEKEGAGGRQPHSYRLSRKNTAWSLRAPLVRLDVWSHCCSFCYLFCCSFCFFGERSSGGGGEFVASPGLPSARRGKNRERGYVSSLSGLLTGLPPFMTTGSVVVLLDGGPPTSLGTASPTSCNEGSRYIATAGEE